METGIWIDKQVAHIITLKENEEIECTSIPSDIDDYQISGGSGTRLKGGPQDVVHDSKYLHRGEMQFKRYFDHILPHLKKVNQFVIFGPAEVGKKLQQEVLDHHITLSNRLRGVVKTDSMTHNQLKAWVKNYFNKMKYAG